MDIHKELIKELRMDIYKELIKQLRKYFYDEPLVMDAADAIEHLLIESNNYRKALEAMR